MLLWSAAVVLLVACYGGVLGQTTLYISPSGSAMGNGTSGFPYDIVTALSVANQSFEAGGNISLFFYSGMSWFKRR